MSNVDGFCVLVLRNFESAWLIAPLGTSDEYVFRSWEQALEFGATEYNDDHLLQWKVVPHKKI